MRSKNILWITLIALLLTTTLAPNITVSASKPTLYLDPDLVTQPSGYFTVAVEVADVSPAPSLYAWEARITYNTGVLEVERRAHVTEGPFLEDAAVPQGYESWFLKSIDNFLGVVSVGGLIQFKEPPDPPYPPVGAVGNGTLAYIQFHIIGSGVSPLDFEYSALYTVIGPNPVEISHDAIGGVFDNRPFNQPPYADFLITAPPPATVGELLKFDGSVSTDDGLIVGYEWDLDYDGITFEVDAVGDTVFKAFDTAGTYKVGLRVTDNDGATNIGDKDILVLIWMEGGTFPDLINWEAKPEKPKWWEATDGQLAYFDALIGNPTSEDYEVYVEFTLHSKDEAKLLGTIETVPQTITEGQMLTVTAELDLTDSTWACFSGSPEWVSYGYYGAGGMRKYAVFARCYYDNGTGYKVGNVVKYFHFNVMPVRHDIGVEMWTVADTVPENGTLDVYANITNYGGLSETFVVDVTYKGEFAQGIVEQRLVTVAAGTTATETFTWDTTGLPLGIYIIKVTLPVLTYEYPRDTANQEDLSLVTII